MRRVFYFLLTNFAILLVLSIVLQLLGVQGYLDKTGTGLDYWNLLVFAAVFGMGGSFISLAISKWMAMRMTGAHVISEPRGELESWLVQTVSHHAQAAGIGMPEVAIFDSPDPNAFATGARQQRGAGRGEQRAPARHEPRRGRGRARPRGEPHRERRHGDARADPGRAEHLRAVPLARRRRRRRPRGVPKAKARVTARPSSSSSIVAQLVLGVLASIIVMWFSRQREFRADSGGARLAGREKMIAALERLKGGAPSRCRTSSRRSASRAAGRPASRGSCRTAARRADPGAAHRRVASRARALSSSERTPSPELGRRAGEARAPAKLGRWRSARSRSTCSTRSST